MLQQMEIYGNLNHEGVFVLSILGQGNQNMVYGSDGRAIEIRALTVFFNSTNCSSLNKVQKIFLIDTCYKRGSENLQPLQPASEHFDDDHANFIAICTSSTKKESVFTKKFSEEVTKAKSNENFLDILRRVEQAVKRTQSIEVINQLQTRYCIKRLKRTYNQLLYIYI